jgi:acetyltransferase-like isoleucine patch superfamily enzyme
MSSRAMTTQPDPLTTTGHLMAINRGLTTGQQGLIAPCTAEQRHCSRPAPERVDGPVSQGDILYPVASAVSRAVRNYATRCLEPMARVRLRGTLLHALRQRTFHSFGRGSIIDRPDWVAGADRIGIGEGVLVLRGAWLAVETPALEREGVIIEIGHRVVIRTHCTISAAHSIAIEEDVTIGALTTIIDNDHTFEGGYQNILYNPLRAAPIRIGAGTWIADRCAVLRGSDIGRCCIIGANSVVRGVVPDYSIAVGAPARVVGSTRACFVTSAHENR